MKVLLILFAVILVIIVGILLLARLGVHTTKTTLATFSEGPDRITLQFNYTTDWGYSRNALLLLFNDRLVDFRGNLTGHENGGSYVFPVRPADLRQLQVDVVGDDTAAALLAQIERIGRTAYLPQAPEFLQLAAAHPKIAQTTPWTVWVNPDDFSAAEYERIKDLLRKGGAALTEQQQEADGAATNQENPLVIIWRTVYFDYQKLTNEVFVRKNGQTEETISVTPGGFADYLQKSERNQSGSGCSLGHLNERADTLVVSRTWKYSDIAFPPAELATFKDAQGRMLAEVYRLAEEPDGPEK